MFKKIARIICAIMVIVVVTGVPASRPSKTFLIPESHQWLTKPCYPQVWNRLRHDFAMPYDSNNPDIQRQINWYRNHPQQFRKILQRSEVFLNYVAEQTHDRSLPAEIALVPLLESDYNPAVNSRTGAAGLWQIMPATGRKFGLKINENYDGRCDVSASTKAALAYMTYLYHHFHQDWLLALAAYDLGEGRVKEALRRSRDHHFWNLSLPKETRLYVPKILALASIIKNPEEFQMTLPDVKPVDLKEINLGNDIKLSSIAEEQGISLKTLQHYNPGFRHNEIHSNYHYTLLLPSEAMFDTRVDQQLESNKDVNNEKSTQSQDIKIYRVKKKDTLFHIAKRFHVTVISIQKLNDLKNSELHIGQQIKIPTTIS